MKLWRPQWDEPLNLPALQFNKNNQARESPSCPGNVNRAKTRRANPISPVNHAANPVTLMISRGRLSQVQAHRSSENTKEASWTRIKRKTSATKSKRHKETTGVTAGNGDTDKVGKQEMHAGIAQRKKDAANDDIVHMPRE